MLGSASMCQSVTDRSRCGLGEKAEKDFSSKLRGFCLQLEVGTIGSRSVVGRGVPEVVVRQRVVWQYEDGRARDPGSEPRVAVSCN